MKNNFLIHQVFDPEMDLQFKLSKKECTFFLRYLGLLLQAGLPLIQALEIIKNEASFSKNAALMSALKREINQGKQFSDALKKFPTVFNGLVCQILKAAEYAGRLDQNLLALAHQQETLLYYQQKIIKAMIYPGFILMAFFGVLTVLLTVVIPQFQTFYLSMNVPMPFAMQYLFNFSQKFYLYLFFLSFFLSFVALFYFLNKEKIRPFLFKLLLKLPVIGSLLNQWVVIRLVNVLKTTMLSGIPVSEALQLAAETLGYPHYQTAVLNAAREIRQGKLLSYALSTLAFVPNRLIQMVRIGEETGQIDEMLTNCSRLYEQETEHYLDRLIQIIEPSLLIFISIFISVFLLTIYLPMIKFVNFL